jgi:hypothetical protein
MTMKHQSIKTEGETQTPNQTPNQNLNQNENQTPMSVDTNVMKTSPIQFKVTVFISDPESTGQYSNQIIVFILNPWLLDYYLQSNSVITNRLGLTKFVCCNLEFVVSEFVNVVNMDFGTEKMGKICFL